MNDSVIAVLIFVSFLIGIPAFLVLSIYLRDSGWSIFAMVLAYIFDYFKLKKLPFRTAQNGITPMKFFEKSLTSPYFIVIALNGSVVTLFAIYVYSQKGQGFALFLLFITFLFVTISFVIMPRMIEIYDDGIAINSRYIGWDTIEHVGFSLPWTSMDGTFVSQTVEITLKERAGVIDVFPMLYKDHKLLRKMLEEYMLQNGIQFSVKERGV